MIRVVVADDHHLVRQGICALLERAGDILIVGQAADGHEAVRLAERLAPDVLLLDLAMPRLNGAEAAAQVRALGLDTHVVILSMYSDPTVVRQVLRNGARGYLLKRSLGEELLLAVRAAVAGEVYLSPTVSGVVVSDLLAVAPEEGETVFGRLTPREREVLQLVAEGHTNAAIARLLQVSIKTVEKHRASLMAKLDVHNVAGLTRIAIKQGLVVLEG